MRLGRVGLSVFFLSSSAWAVPGQNVTYTPGENELTISSDEGSKSMPIQCSAKSTLVHKGKLYVACGDQGVLVFSLEDPLQPKQLQRMAVEGTALEVVASGDEVQVRTQTVQLKPLKPAPRTTFAPWTAPTSSFQPAPCPTYEPPPRKPSKWPGIMAPQRRIGATIGGEVHGFIAVSNGGGGIGMDAHVTIRVPWAAFHAHMWPLAMGFDNKGNQLAVSAFGIVSLDTDFFELGIGGGGMTYNVGPRSNSAFELPILLRIGAADGLAFTSIVEVEANDPGVSLGMPTGPKWDFAAFRGIFAIPMGETIQLHLRGMGGVSGFASGDVALRYRFRGDGGRGSLYGLVSLGGYGTFFSGFALAGPALSVGVEWRP